MNGTWKKLNLTDCHREIVVVNAPKSFEAELAKLQGVTIVSTCRGAKTIQFMLAFVTRLAEVERVAKQVVKKADNDAVVWFAYPKQTSKKHRCEFNRDNGWQALLNAGFRGVRQVAIDEDWSAIRFRRVEFIKKELARNTRR